MRDNDIPAFPGEQPYFAIPDDLADQVKRIRTRTNGMTLRDYFAAKAMQGIISASGDNNGHVDYHEDWVAKNAYKMADAMLKAREAE